MRFTPLEKLRSSNGTAQTGHGTPRSLQKEFIFIPAVSSGVF
jgi:hypothetical protein